MYLIGEILQDCKVILLWEVPPQEACAHASLGRVSISDASVDVFVSTTKRFIADKAAVTTTESICLAATFWKDANNVQMAFAIDRIHHARLVARPKPRLIKIALVRRLEPVHSSPTLRSLTRLGTALSIVCSAYEYVCEKVYGFRDSNTPAATSSS